MGSVPELIRKQEKAYQFAAGGVDRQLEERLKSIL
jgi:hypothetical protein